MSARPLIGLCTDAKLIDPHVYQSVGDKYIHAVAAGAGALPILVPSTEAAVDVQTLIGHLDGLVLPGSYANVHPSHYGNEDPYDGSPLDPVRDMATLGIIPLAIDAGIPVLGICRGFQEMNVAFGGTLHQRLHEVDGHMDHRENEDDDLDGQYGPSHPVDLVPGGLLESITGQRQMVVNSLHGQGVSALGPGLQVEATAEDGVVEAFSIPRARAFALAVQWHPEWRFAEHAGYLALWQAFGEACRERARTKSTVNEEASWPSVTS